MTTGHRVYRSQSPGPAECAKMNMRRITYARNLLIDGATLMEASIQIGACSACLDLGLWRYLGR